jgi:hypothetical protein
MGARGAPWVEGVLPLLVLGAGPDDIQKHVNVV